MFRITQEYFINLVDVDITIKLYYNNESKLRIPFVLKKLLSLLFTLFVLAAVVIAAGIVAMSDLTATNCGCNNSCGNNNCGNGIFGNSCIWIILLLFCGGGCGNNNGCGLLGSNNGCGVGE